MTEPIKKRTDWEAVERDYRTDKFTLRELGEKHSADPGLISRKAKQKGWTKDLAVAIKQATDAKLVEQLVNKEVNKSQQKVNNAVDVAAEVNVRIIRGQHSRLTVLDALFEAGAKKAKTLLSTAKGARDSHTAVQAMANVMLTAKTLTEMERKVFKLDDAPPPPPPGPGESDAPRLEGFGELLDKALQKATAPRAA